MTDSPPNSIEATLAHLCQAPEPVTFYDVQLLVRRLPRGHDLPESVLHGLVTLHDAANATDGAREILADFLRTYASRLARQQALANGPLLFKHSGQCARGLVGQSLTLVLDEHRGAGYRWEVVLIVGPVQCRRVADTAVEPPTARFTVSLLRRGRARIVLREMSPPLQAATRPMPSARQPRSFELDIVIE